MTFHVIIIVHVWQFIGCVHHHRHWLWACPPRLAVDLCTGYLRCW